MSLESAVSVDRLSKEFATKSVPERLETNSLVPLPEKKSLQDAEASDNEQQQDSEKSVYADLIDPEKVKQTLESINRFIPIINTKLVFEFDELGDPPIIKVIDKESNEIIREIPSQDLVKVAKAFSDMVDNLNKAGALINYKA